MSVSIFRLAKASRAEREVLSATRALYHGRPPAAALSNAAQNALKELADKAKQKGYAVWTCNAAYVSADELKLLGGLAMLQREQPDALVPIDPSLLIELARAAEALKLIYPLPYQAVLRAGFVEGKPRPVQGLPTTNQYTYLPGKPKFARHASMGARAVAYARKNGRVSSKQLCAIGISNQYLSILCQKGMLIRIRPGFYEAPPREHVERHSDQDSDHAVMSLTDGTGRRQAALHSLPRLARENAPPSTVQGIS